VILRKTWKRGSSDSIAIAGEGKANSEIYFNFKAMKPSYTFLLWLLLAATGCTKSTNNSPYFQFRLNSVMYSFDSVVVWVDTTAGARFATIDGLNTKTLSTFHVDMQSYAETLNGTYSRLNPTPASQVLMGFGVLISAGQNNYDSYDLEGQYFTLSVSGSANNKITGSFSGSLGEQFANQNASVTNGQFDLPYNYR
jgi:hypothetical protein